jgi:hypothetical protein
MVEIATASTTNGLWQTIVARPGLMIKRGTYSGEASMILGGTSGSFIRSNELALALIDAAQHGGRRSFAGSDAAPTGSGVGQIGRRKLVSDFAGDDRDSIIR